MLCILHCPIQYNKVYTMHANFNMILGASLITSYHKLQDSSPRQATHEFAKMYLIVISQMSRRLIPVYLSKPVCTPLCTSSVY